MVFYEELFCNPETESRFFFNQNIEVRRLKKVIMDDTIMLLSI